jgi:cytosine/adenosine deaminase-related metal-dependent hydrolase
LEGARALGLESETGSLETGKWGDVAAILPLDRYLDSNTDPIEQVLASAPGDTLLTILGGRLAYRRDPPA